MTPEQYRALGVVLAVSWSPALHAVLIRNGSISDYDGKNPEKIPFSAVAT